MVIVKARDNPGLRYVAYAGEKTVRCSAAIACRKIHVSETRREAPRLDYARQNAFRVRMASPREKPNVVTASRSRPSRSGDSVVRQSGRSCARSQVDDRKAGEIVWNIAFCAERALFCPEAVEEFEGILCRAIEDSFAAALEQIKAHREGRGAGDVFRELQQIFGDVFICACYLLGHVHGVERNLKDRTSRLDEVFQRNPQVKGLITRFERILSELWLQEYVLESIEVFAPIYDLICEMMAQCGLVFARHEEEWRIVMYEEREAIEAANKALSTWANSSGPEVDEE